MSTFRSRPPWPVRWLLRLPCAVYRVHGGWIFGRRFLMLRHRGRVSGLVRETALEVVGYDAAQRESFVVSAWGTRADWFRNISAQPALEVWTGRTRYAPAQRTVDADEAQAVMQRYIDHTPFAAALVRRLVGYDLRDADGLRRFASEVPMIAFRPSSRESVSAAPR